MEDLVAQIAKDAECTRGLINACVYAHKPRDMSLLHYGDDFLILGRRRDVRWLKEQISQTLIVKDRGCIGPREDDLSSITLLHRTIYYDKKADELFYSADPKHAKMLIEAYGFNAKSNGVVTPGVKVKPTPENSKPLGTKEAAEYRSNCMRLGYLALDRVDLQFSAKECARGMSNPTHRHLEILKRCVRYLIRRPMCAYSYKRQRLPRELSVYSDADWAGCPLTRKSTSGTIVMIGSHIIFTQSSTQAPLATSSGESEFYGCVKAASRGLGLRQLAADLGIFILNDTQEKVSALATVRNGTPLHLRLYTDSSSAMGTACKRGCGKIRHIEVGSLWLQQVVADKKITIAKILGTKNPPDILTKFGDTKMLEYVCSKLGLVFTR